MKSKTRKGPQAADSWGGRPSAGAAGMLSLHILGCSFLDDDNDAATYEESFTHAPLRSPNDLVGTLSQI